jgi:hypothetical protein
MSSLEFKSVWQKFEQSMERWWEMSSETNAFIFSEDLWKGGGHNRIFPLMR